MADIFAFLKDVWIWLWIYFDSLLFLQKKGKERGILDEMPNLKYNPFLL